MDIDLADPDGCFQITPIGNTQAVMALDPDTDSKKRPHAASVIINTGEHATFNVTFRPSAVQRSQVLLEMGNRRTSFELSLNFEGKLAV